MPRKNQDRIVHLLVVRIQTSLSLPVINAAIAKAKGTEKPMTYIDIICEDTVDDKIVLSLRKKVNIATEIMGEELKAWI